MAIRGFSEACKESYTVLHSGASLDTDDSLHPENSFYVPSSFTFGYTATNFLETA
jgi:hypothetical protein